VYFTTLALFFTLSVFFLPSVESKVGFCNLLNRFCNLSGSLLYSLELYSAFCNLWLIEKSQKQVQRGYEKKGPKITGNRK